MYRMLNSIGLWLKLHVRSERGQDLIEYAMLGGLIAVALALSSLLLLTGGIADMGDGIASCVDFDGGTDCGPF